MCLTEDDFSTLEPLAGQSPVGDAEAFLRMHGRDDDRFRSLSVTAMHGMGVDASAYPTGLVLMAVTGASCLLGMARMMVDDAVRELGGDTPVSFPETAYGLPSYHAWTGAGDMDLSALHDALDSMDIEEGTDLDHGLMAGETAMLAAEAMECISYLRGLRDDGWGFIPDRVLRSLGLSFVDDTIPGCAVIMGDTDDGDGLVKMVRDCQSRGMVLVVSGGCTDRIRDKGISMGLDRMLYPVGSYTGVVHALNFAVRAALSFGGVAAGDRDRLDAYLQKRPKTFVLHLGPLTNLDAALAFAAVMHHASIVSETGLPEIPGIISVHRDHDSSVQKGIELRGIEIRAAPIDLPVPYGPAFEGEVLRRPDTHVEFGGGRSDSFELLVSRPEDEVEDGRTKIIGDDIDSFPKGSNAPLAILVEVYGQRMESDLEAVMERRIHQFVNYGDGLWHTGQRDLNWIRISDKAYANGLRLRHLAEILTHKLKEEFGRIVTRIQVSVITDPESMEGIKEEAKRVYGERDARLAGLTDDSVDTFYTCSMCQSFAPDHICIISPERLGLCGAINWLDAKAGYDLLPSGPNQPVPKGTCIDCAKGEWEGVNERVLSDSHGTVDRICMYSLMDAPMTSCGCFEVIVAMTPDMQAAIAVHREHTGMTPVGMKFSTLAGSIGGGRQTPGFMGVGRKYLSSDKFMAAEGGFLRIAWMPKALKDSLRNVLDRIGERSGIPDLADRIADETITEDAEGLMRWMTEKDHPALHMDPLI